MASQTKKTKEFTTSAVPLIWWRTCFFFLPFVCSLSSQPNVVHIVHECDASDGNGGHFGFHHIFQWNFVPFFGRRISFSIFSLFDISIDLRLTDVASCFIMLNVFLPGQIYVGCFVLLERHAQSYDFVCHGISYFDFDLDYDEFQLFDFYEQHRRHHRQPLRLPCDGNQFYWSWWYRPNSFRFYQPFLLLVSSLLHDHRKK